MWLDENLDPSAYDVRSLRYAEHFSVWALRTSVACSPQCRTLLREFQTAFGAHNDEGISAYYALMTSLGKGIRKVRIGRPGHIELTADELSLVEMLAAAQSGDEERFRAHARWIMGHNQLDELYESAQRFTHMLLARDHRFRKPDASNALEPTEGKALRMAAGSSQSIH